VRRENAAIIGNAGRSQTSAAAPPLRVAATSFVLPGPRPHGRAHQNVLLPPGRRRPESLYAAISRTPVRTTRIGRSAQAAGALTTWHWMTGSRAGLVASWLTTTSAVGNSIPRVMMALVRPGLTFRKPGHVCPNLHRLVTMRPKI